MPYNPTTINPLQAWVQTVIPTVYDDSLSYLEFLGKVLAKLNELIASDAAQSAALSEFLASFEGNLTQTVTDYLDVWKEDGTIQAILTASLDEFIAAEEAHETLVAGQIAALETDLEAQIDTKQTAAFVNVKDYGATGNGVTNDTAAVNAGITAAAGKTLYFPDGVYLIDPIILTCSISMENNAKFLYNGSAGSVVIAVTANGLTGNIRLDVNNKAPYACVLISGNSNHFKLIEISNMTANDGLGLSNVKSGIYLSGNDNIIDHYFAKDLDNDGHVNPSMPQAIGIVGTSARNLIINAYIKDSAAGLVTDTSGNNKVINLYLNNVVSNGIYDLETGSGVTYVDNFIFDGGSQPIVSEGKMSIGKMTVLQCTNGVIGVQGNAITGYLTIGELVLGEGLAPTGGSIIKTRPANVQYGRVSIGSVVGSIKSPAILDLSVGKIRHLSIKNVQIRFLYDAAVCTDVANFGNFTACDSFDFINWSLKIIDVNNVLVGTETFRIKKTSATTIAYSNVRDVLIQFLKNDETTSLACIGYITNLKENALIRTKGMQFMVNVGPYAREQFTFPEDSATGIPAVGTWVKGDILWNYSPTAGGYVGWVCITGGTPGTWKGFGLIQA